MHHRPRQWDVHHPLKSLSETPLTDGHALAKHLYMNTYGDVAISSTFLGSKVKSEVKQLERMFSTDVATRNGSSRWYHSLMQCIVLDRVSWALAPFQHGTIQRHSQRANMNVSNPNNSRPNNSSAMQLAMDTCADWQTSMGLFLQGWMIRHNASSEASEVKPLDNDSTGKLAIASLGYTMNMKTNSAKIDQVEANFCAAALGLTAIAQASLTIYGLKCR